MLDADTSEVQIPVTLAVVMLSASAVTRPYLSKDTEQAEPAVSRAGRSSVTFDPVCWALIAEVQNREFPDPPGPAAAATDPSEKVYPGDNTTQ